MKTNTKLNLATIVLMSVSLIFSSCQKEKDCKPENIQQASERTSASYVFPAASNMYGYSYSVWSAKWWAWAMEQPLNGHPFVDAPGFNVTSGQSGEVWFLAAPFGTVVRSVTIPADKAIFIPVFNGEASDLEGLGNTAADQRANANWLADHIIQSSLFFNIDNMQVNNLSGNYRFTSPQFSFNAPTPWIYGNTGGPGTAVGDGYYVMVKPLSAGTHTIHYGGEVLFTLANDGFDYDGTINMTYNITVQ
jgi:hypothetical protein